MRLVLRTFLNNSVVIFLLSWWALLPGFFSAATAEAQSATEDEQKSPSKVLDVLRRPVNDRLVYGLVLGLGQRFVESPECASAAELNEQLKRRVAPARIGTPTRREDIQENRSAEKVYESMVRSSLIIGSIYDCGKCDNLHVSTAGGVLISKDGLVLTNHHVIEQDGDGTKCLVAVTHDGQVFPIQEVLSASKSDDVALVRLSGDTRQLEPAPLASETAPMLSGVRVLSHPHRHYFVLSEGKVSRYSYDSNPRRGSTVWMEITAEFGAGSSGSGVFNEQGEIVGLVSRVVPLIRKGTSRTSPAEKAKKGPKSDVTEVILHRCVSLESIKKRFADD